MITQDVKKIKRLISMMIKRIPDQQLIIINKDLVEIKDNIDSEIGRRSYNEEHNQTGG